MLGTGIYIAIKTIKKIYIYLHIFQEDKFLLACQKPTCVRNWFSLSQTVHPVFLALDSLEFSNSRIFVPCMLLADCTQQNVRGIRMVLEK